MENHNTTSPSLQCTITSNLMKNKQVRFVILHTQVSKTISSAYLMNDWIIFSTAYHSFTGYLKSEDISLDNNRLVINSCLLTKSWRENKWIHS